MSAKQDNLEESLRLSDEDLRKLEIPLQGRSRTYRFFEILPGVMSYLVVATPLVVGIWRADIAGYLILLFMLVWFFRTISMAVKALSTLATTREIEGTDWLALLKDDYENANENLNILEKKRNLSRLDKFRKKCLIKFEISTDETLEPDDLIHVVMTPTVFMTELFSAFLNALNMIGATRRTYIFTVLNYFQLFKAFCPFLAAV